MLMKIELPAYAHEYPLFVVETKKDIVGNESQVHMHVELNIFDIH